MSHITECHRSGHVQQQPINITAEDSNWLFLTWSHPLWLLGGQGGICQLISGVLHLGTQEITIDCIGDEIRGGRGRGVKLVLQLGGLQFYTPSRWKASCLRWPILLLPQPKRNFSQRGCLDWFILYQFLPLSNVLSSQTFVFNLQLIDLMNQIY